MSDITKNTSFDVEVNSAAQIYGAVWAGGSNSKWVRTDAAADFPDPDPYVADGNHPGSSPFDNIMPWSGMVKETISGVGTCVKIPKYYYKWTRSGETMMLQITDSPVEGFFTSPAHADRGDGVGERDYVYVGRYHCSSNYQSTSGVSPKTEMSRATARSSIHNLNTNAWQYDFAMYWTIMMLYLVEFADWNSQKVIGNGLGTRAKVGASDSMEYHTGTMQSSRDTFGVGIQYHYIEGLWENCLDWCDGIYFDENKVYCIKNPNQFSDTTGGTLVGTRPTSGGYIKAWTNPSISGFEYALYPSVVGGSDSTYITDYCEYDSDGITLLIGGDFGQDLGSGAFSLAGYVSASGVSDNIVGCRLMYLPDGGGQPITSIPVTISGSGIEPNCCVTYKGTVYTGGTFSVAIGDTLELDVFGYSASKPGTVDIDGERVMEVTKNGTGYYSYIVPNNIKSIKIQLDYSAFDLGLGHITVTTS